MKEKIYAIVCPLQSKDPEDNDWTYQVFKNNSEAKKYGKKHNCYMLRMYYLRILNYSISINKIIFEPFK